MAGTYKRWQWCQDFLAAIGNQDASALKVGTGVEAGSWGYPTTYYDYTLRWVIAWTAMESRGGEKGYNLLKTTQPMSGSTAIAGNSAGVQIYNTYADGISANAQTLQNGNYGALLHALQTEDLNGLGISISTVPLLGAKLRATAKNIYDEMQIWNGHAVSYNANRIASEVVNHGPIVDGWGNEDFPGDAGSGPPDALTAIGNLFGTINASLQPLAGTPVPRVLVGVLGIILFGIGAGIATKILTPANISKAVKLAAL